MLFSQLFFKKRTQQLYHIVTESFCKQQGSPNLRIYVKHCAVHLNRNVHSQISPEIQNTFLFQTTSSSGGETTTSTLTYTPRAGDSGRVLRCRASNPELHRGVMEDSWKLDVQCEFLT